MALYMILINEGAPFFGGMMRIFEENIYSSNSNELWCFQHHFKVITLEGSYRLQKVVLKLFDSMMIKGTSYISNCCEREMSPVINFLSERLFECVELGCL